MLGKTEFERKRWRTMAARILVGTLTLQLSLVDTILTAPHSLAAETELTQVLSLPAEPTDVMILGSTENPANTINRATDAATFATVTVPDGVDSVTVALYDTNGKHVEKTKLVHMAGSVSMSLNAISLADGPISVRALLKTTTGTTSNWVTGTAATKDTEKPAKPIISSPTDNLSTVASFATIEGQVENQSTITATMDHKEIAHTVSAGTFSLSTPLQAGKNNIKVIATDTAGNQSEAVRVPTILNTVITEPTPSEPVPTTTQTEAGKKTKLHLNEGQQTFAAQPDQPVSITTAPDTTNHGRVTVESLGHQNPFSNNLPNLTTVGNYYQMLTTNQTIFPLDIKIYYTQKDLDSAHITNERQLKGLYFYDVPTKIWKSFDKTGVNTTDVTVGGTQYAGYLFATTTHLTTMVAGADVTPPTRPANLTAEAGDGRIKLTWNSVADAAGYWVRYRKATSIDTATYTSVFVSGPLQTSYTTSDLANGTLYEFGLASEDSAGNQSSFSIVEQTPTAAAPTTDFITPATAHLTNATSNHVAVTTAVSSTPARQSSSQPSVSSTTQPDTTAVPDNQNDDDTGSIKGGSDKKDQTQSARSLVTLLIVLVAAAAGFGGYYGYQWWTARPEDYEEPVKITNEEPPTPKKPTKDKNDRTGGRW